MKKARATTEARLFAQNVGRALRRAAKVARNTARAYHTPIYVWQNGKVVAKKP
jgi:superfamily II DNA or RNA helicase